MTNLDFPVSSLARRQTERGVIGAVRSDQAPPFVVQYLRVAVRRKWIIAGAIIGTLIASLVVTLLTTPQYTAVAKIEIAREANKVVNIQAVEPEAAGFDLEFYQTQYGLLRANSLAERVARQLRLSEDPSFFQAFGARPERFFPANTVERNSPAVRAERERKAGEILLDNLSIAPDRGSRLVNVYFTSPDPALSARVSNAWTANFIRSNLERRFEATAYARNFLESRLEQIRQHLESSERALVGYASAQRIINLPTATTAGGQVTERPLQADELAALNMELAAATAARIQAQARLVGRTSQGLSPEALSNTTITTLRHDRAQLAAEYSRLMQQFEPEYPGARAIQAQIANLDRSIAREEARVQASFSQGFAQSQAREQALSQRVEQLKSAMLNLRSRSIQYNIFQRDVDTNRELYNGLLQRYKEIGIAGGVGTNNIAVVDPAEVPERPSSPRLFRNLMAGLGAGLLLGFLLALAREQIDEAIRDPADVESLLDLPVLGVIPRVKVDEPVRELDDPKSPLLEAYISARTSLGFSTDHGVPRSLAITSTRAGEGKSTTAYALALTLARGQARVLLIDADLRAPSIHGLLNLSNKAGLSNFLAGSDDLRHLITPTPYPRLSVMVAGPTPPNAAQLLSGDRLKTLIDRLTTDFDHVVIDAPPVMGLADAPLVGSQVDGLVFTIEAHSTGSGMIKIAIKRLEAARTKILGVILAKFESKRSSYGYGYDYGYGYGAAELPSSDARSESDRSI